MDKTILKAIECLRLLIVGTQYENHVFLCDEMLRDYLMGRPVSSLQLVIEEIDGAEDFGEWICRQIGQFKCGENPIVMHSTNTCRFKLSFEDELKDLDISCRTSSLGYGKTGLYGIIENDVTCHDFTVDSLYLNITDGTVIDPTNKGLNDIKEHVIRCIDGQRSFSTDPYKMVEAITLAAELDASIASETWVDILLNAHRCKSIVRSRICLPLCKILKSQKPSISFDRLRYSGIMEVMLPEFYSLIGVTQGPEFNADVYDYTMKVVDASDDKITFRWAALLHAVAKPKCKMCKGTHIVFPRYALESAVKAAGLLTEIGIPSSSIASILAAIRGHVQFTECGNRCPSNKSLKKFISDAKGNEAIILGLIDAMNNSFADGFKLDKQVGLIKNKIEELKNPVKQPKKDALISGKDLMAHFNLVASPKIGALLRKAESIIKNNASITKEECLSELKPYVATC